MNRPPWSPSPMVFPDGVPYTAGRALTRLLPLGCLLCGKPHKVQMFVHGPVTPPGALEPYAGCFLLCALCRCRPDPFGQAEALIESQLPARVQRLFPGAGEGSAG